MAAHDRSAVSQLRRAARLASHAAGCLSGKWRERTAGVVAVLLQVHRSTLSAMDGAQPVPCVAARTLERSFSEHVTTVWVAVWQADGHTATHA